MTSLLISPTSVNDGVCIQHLTIHNQDEYLYMQLVPDATTAKGNLFFFFSLYFVPTSSRQIISKMCISANRVIWPPLFCDFFQKKKGYIAFLKFSIEKKRVFWRESSKFVFRLWRKPRGVILLYLRCVFRSKAEHLSSRIGLERKKKWITKKGDDHAGTTNFVPHISVTNLK